MDGKQLKKTTQSVGAIVDLIEAVPGVISVHGQLADTLAVVVVLVESDAAQSAIRELECKLFDTADTPPIDIRVRRVEVAEIAERQRALDTAYGRLGSRN